MLCCTHADLYTLTYADEVGPEARVSAKMRNVHHLQRFKKVLRQIERRRIKKYNNRERKAAIDQGREPLLVDPTRSYIKFIDAHEYGTKGTERSHFHVLAMYESHFPIPPEAIRTGDFRQTVRYARRVWSPEAVFGDPPKRLPKEANDPAVLSFRTTSFQKWHPWPHGGVQVQCASHHRDQGDGTQLKTPADMAKAIRYIQKYLLKDVRTKGKDGEAPTKTWKTPENYRPACRSATRTMSRGLGNQYAQEWAKERAEAGVPIDDFKYTIIGHNVNRTPKSEGNRRNALAGMGIRDEASLHAMTDRQKYFQMRGAMARLALTTYRIHREARLGRKITLTEMGEEAIRHQMQIITDEHNKFLRSPEAEAKRFEAKARYETVHYIERGVQQTGTTRHSLPLELTPVHVFERGPDGELLDGTNGEKPKHRPAADRLKEREAEIAKHRAIYDAFDAERTPLETLKEQAGRMTVNEISTEVLYANRPRYERERFRREIDAERICKIEWELEQRIKQGDAEAEEDLEWLREFNKISERAAFGLNRHDIHVDGISNKRLWHWVNCSDDYEFPALREALIFLHCDMLASGPGWRLIRNPKGDTFLQRRVWSKEPARIGIYDEPGFSGRKKYKKEFERWATRKVPPERLAEAIAGDMSLRAPTDRDPIFRGPEPLKKGVASGPDGEPETRPSEKSQPERRAGVQGGQGPLFKTKTSAGSPTK